VRVTSTFDRKLSFTISFLWTKVQSRVRNRTST
jgi:hypothetical protein